MVSTRPLRLLSALLLAAAALGCDDTAPMAPARPVVASDEALLTCRPQTVVRLYFGAQTPDGEVDDAAWQGFVAGVVAPRFADGFTVLDARGQWRGADGRVISERSRVLEIVGADDRARRQALVETVAGYKALFRQQAVLVTHSDTRVCY